MQVTGNAGVGDSHQFKAAIFDLAFDSAGHDGLDALGHAGGTCVINHGDAPLSSVRDN